MDYTMLQRATEIKKEHQFTKRWKQVVAVICAITVISTTNALTLPAITEHTEVYCGHEEHVHSIEAGCYEEKTVLDCHFESAPHVHSDTCYEEYQVLTCGLEEGKGHTHSEACFDENGNIVCGLEECEGHIYTDTCFETKRKLICGLEEGALEQTHEHTEECYHPELVLVCDKEEHHHTLACFSNPEADVESFAVWEQSFQSVGLTGVWANDVLAIADTQLGYTESSRNYIVEDDGITTKGYTRYGDWYGDTYGDWCAMFCSFCLNYAGVDRSVMPFEENCQSWIEALESRNLYHPAGSYDPKPGDLIFFYDDEYSHADHVGFVYEVSDNSLKTIEGNNGPQVAYHTYSLSDVGIMGHGELPENPNHLIHAEPEEQIFECTRGAAEEEAHSEGYPLYELMLPENEEEYVSITSNETENGVSVMICGPAASFPCPKEEIVVRLTQLTDENDEIAEAIDEKTEEEAVSELMLFDITLFRGDEEIQPTGPIELRFIGIEKGDSGNVQTYHVEDEDNINPVETTVNDDGVISVETDHFSKYAVAKFNNRASRDISSSVDRTDVNVWLNGYHIVVNGHAITPNPEQEIIAGTVAIKFDLTWAVDTDFHPQSGDYFDMEIATFSSYSVSAYLENLQVGTRPVMFNNSVYIGVASLNCSNGQMILHVEFTEDIVSQINNLHGDSDGTFYARDIQEGTQSTISVGGQESYTWTQEELPPSGSGSYGPDADDPGEDYKRRVLSETNSQAGNVEWQILLKSLVDEQFRSNIVFNDYLIVEDTLDQYQTFFIPNPVDPNYSYVHLYSFHKIYLPNADGNGYSGYCLGLGNGDDWDIGRLDIPSTAHYYDPSHYAGTPEQQYEAAERDVRTHSKSYTIIKERNKDNQEVEKLILNLGRPGYDGYRWSDLSFYDETTGYPITFSDIVQKVYNMSSLCSSVAANSSAAMDEPITHDYWTYTKAQWQEFSQMFYQAYLYLFYDPYLYDWKIDIATHIKSDPELGDPGSVVNHAYVAGGPYGSKWVSAEAYNDWRINAYGDLGNYDVFIGKYDAAGGTQSFSGTNMRVNNPVKAKFEVQDINGNTLHFSTPEDFSNGYNYNPSGTVTQMWTADDGILILHNLPGGTYYLYEVAADSPYYTHKASEPIATFEVANDGYGTYVGVANNMRRVVLEKKDSQNQQPLAGAQFELQKQNSSGTYEQLTGFSIRQINGQSFFYHDGSGFDRITTDSSGKIDLRGLPIGSYRLEEVEPPTKYELPSGDAVYTYFTLSEYEDEDDLTEATDGGPDYLLVSVENSLEPQPVSLTITKSVTFGDLTKSFPFTVTLKDTDENTVKLPARTYTPTGSVSYIVDTDGTITFTLTHNQSVIIEDIPIGTRATVNETSHDGYTTLVKKGNILLSDSDELTDYEVTADSELTYYNNRGAELPETGGFGTTPIYALGAMLMAGALMWGCKLRRRRERRAR